MKTDHSLGNRLTALILSIILVLGMFPAGVAASEDATAYGTVESLSEGVTITGSEDKIKATYAGTLNWIAKDESVGRYSDGWWAGIKVTAPATLNLEKAQYTSGGTKKSFNQYKDSADGADKHFITLWGLINEEYLRNANLASGRATYTYTFDWDGDGTFEQTVLLEFDAKNTVLVNKAGATVYPAASAGAGKAEGITAGATISGTEQDVAITYAQLELGWSAADPAAGRGCDGWWVGIKMTAPAQMTKQADFTNVTYQRMDGGAWSAAKSFWNAQDSNKNAADTARYLTMWGLVNPDLIAAANGGAMLYKYRFDWNGDGIYEQTLTLKIETADVTLMKNGIQQYPLRYGAVESLSGGNVSGSNTSSSVVSVEDITLTWHKADPAAGRGSDGWWVGAKITAPADMTTQADFTNVTYQRMDSGSWSAAKSFWNAQDSNKNAADTARYLTMWGLITPELIEAGNGRVLNYKYRFDWNQDGVYEQELTLKIDPSEVTLLDKDGVQVHPTLGEVTALTGGTVTGNGTGNTTVLIENAELTWFEANPENGRVQDGWWTGIKVTAPAGTVAENVKYRCKTADGWTEAMEFKPDDSATNSLELWGLITAEYLEQFKNAGKNLNYVWQFSWDGDEVYEQTVTMSVVPTGIVLKQAGFDFAKKTDTITYGDNDNLYTIPAPSGGQSGKKPVYSIDNTDVATLIADGKDGKEGKLQILKAGTVTITATLGGDFYSDITASYTLTVEKADQTGFGFGETEKVEVTYNENGNQYTLEASGGQSGEDIVYTVVSGDAAIVDESTGVVTINKAGTVVIEAKRPADDYYKEISDTYTLNIEKDNQEYTLTETGTVALKYGTQIYTNAVKPGVYVSVKNKPVYTIAENDMGASVNSETGEVTFADSQGKVGTVTVTVTVAGDECYNQFSDTYNITLSYAAVPASPYTLHGDKIITGSDWFTSDVLIFAANGYLISFSNALEGNTWGNSVPWTKDGDAEFWAKEENQASAPVVYLKHIETGAITDAIPVTDLKRDTEKPGNLSIHYTTDVVATIGEKLFGIHATEVQVSISATDAMSGIGKMEYSLDEGKTYTEVPANKNGEYEFVSPAQYRGQLWIRATDVAGNSEIYKHMEDDAKKILVVDQTAPGLTVGYSGTMADHATEGIRYVKGDRVTIVVEVSDENFDLREFDPVVTVNGAKQTEQWVFTDTMGKLTFDLTEEGDYVIHAEFTDRLRRKVEYHSEVRIDRKNPIIDPGIVNGTYYKENQNFTLSVTEHNFDASKVSLTVDAVDSKNNPVLTEAQKLAFAELAANIENWGHTEGTDVYTLKLPITVDGNYVVQVDCKDDLDLPATETRTFTLDKENPDKPTLLYEVGAEKSELIIDTILEKLFGFARETVVVTVQSGDATSGIDRLEYKLHDEDKFTVVSMDDEGKYSFNLDPQYRGKITVVVYDKAGRSCETVEEKEIVVDNIAPEVEIAFSGDRKDAVKADSSDSITRETMSAFDETTRFVYDNSITATITVKEANFFPDNDDMTITITHDGETIHDWAAAGITDSGWQLANEIYTRTIVLTADPENHTTDGDYQILAEYRDHSMNDMEWASGEYQQSGKFRYQSNIHTIDTKKPVYEVTYDNTNLIQVRNDREYYAAGREATIRVTDRNFRPDQVKFSVDAQDIAGNNITEYTYSKLTSWADWTKTDEYTWTATVLFALDANYTVTFDYVDIAGNKAESAYSKQFTVDTVAPDELAVTYKAKDDQVLNKILDAITFGNYKADQEVILTMTDTTAGIDYIKLIVTPDGSASATDLEMPKDLELNADGTVKSGSKGFIGAVKSSEENGHLELRFDVPAQFRGKVRFVAYDKSGKHNDQHADPGVLVVDTIAPEHTISYNPANVVQVSDMKDMRDFNGATGITDAADTNNSYVMYFSGDAVATIKIAEANFDPTVVTLEVLDAEGKPVDGWKQSDWTTTAEAGKADVHTKTITISAEGDYRIRVYYQDHSMNAPVDYLSQRIVVDKTAPVVHVQYDNTDVKNIIDNRSYFSKAQTATITIKEHNFRADDVVIKVTAKDVLGADVLTLDADGFVRVYADQGTDRSGWSAYEAGTWRRADDTYEITLNYSAEANYTFNIEYQDLAKNKAADYAADRFTVDTTAPKNLTVKYSTSFFEQVLESVTFGYYNAQMTVTITAEDDTAGIYHFAYSYINSEGVSGVNKELLDQAIKEAQITYDGKKATATFTVPKMVLGNDNQFNGTVAFTAYDRSENSNDLKDSTRIIVDNISPTASVTYNAPVQNVNGSAYYDGNISGTIVINEANFDAADVQVTVTRNGAAYPTYVSWYNNSVDTHTGSFVLNEDGDYIVSVQYKDKSGNQMAAYTSQKLVRDATTPSIKVSNIKANSANKDDRYGFVIEISDTNLDVNSMKPVLKTVKKNAADVYEVVEIDLGKANAVVDGQTYTYTVENLPDDGLYTLICEAKDLSGNAMSQIVLEDGKAYDQVQFSINRNGSVFSYGNTFAEELVKQCYVYSVDEDIVIVEVNVDPIEEYTVSLNGKELKEGTDYTTEQTSKSGEWSKRTYTISKELFSAEGEYSIIVTSTDKTNTTAFSDVKNLEMSFVVDQTKPVLTITGLEAGGRYQTDAQTVTLIPTDEGGRLNKLSIVVLDANGEPLMDANGENISVRFEMAGEELLKYLQDNDGKVTFTVPEGLNHRVQIICNDCAVNAEDLTNEYNELFRNVTVSRNQLVIFYANTPLFYGTIAGVLALIVLIIVLVKRKKDKKAKA